MLAHENIRKFAEEIIMSHELDGMEAILYTDGDYWIRQSGSTGTHENEIMVTIPLGKSYWDESYIWGEDLEKDQELKETAIDDLVEDINYRIQDWQDQQAELKKMKEYYEEERKALEDMMGL